MYSHDIFGFLSRLSELNIIYNHLSKDEMRNFIAILNSTEEKSIFNEIGENLVTAFEYECKKEYYYSAQRYREVYLLFKNIYILGEYKFFIRKRYFRMLYEDIYESYYINSDYSQTRNELNDLLNMTDIEIPKDIKKMCYELILKSFYNEGKNYYDQKDYKYACELFEEGRKFTNQIQLWMDPFNNLMFYLKKVYWYLCQEKWSNYNRDDMEVALKYIRNAAYIDDYYKRKKEYLEFYYYAFRILNYSDNFFSEIQYFSDGSIDGRYLYNKNQLNSSLKSKIEQIKTNISNLNSELNSITNDISNTQLIINSKKIIISDKNSGITNLNNLIDSLLIKTTEVTNKIDENIDTGKEQVKQVEKNIKKKEDFIKEIKDLEKKKEEEILDFKKKNQDLKEKNKQLLLVLNTLEAKF